MECSRRTDSVGPARPDLRRWWRSGHPERRYEKRPAASVAFALQPRDPRAYAYDSSEAAGNTLDAAQPRRLRAIARRLRTIGARIDLACAVCGRDRVCRRRHNLGFDHVGVVALRRVRIVRPAAERPYGEDPASGKASGPVYSRLA